jgi:hypothetical protein
LTVARSRPSPRAKPIASTPPPPCQPTPVLVEHPLAGEIGGVAVQGIADLITLDACVTDLKTASKKPGPISGDQS